MLTRINLGVTLRRPGRRSAVARERHVDVDEVIWLGERGGDNVAAVGGKAAQLSRLAACYNVPPGFTVTTAAFADALRAAMRDAGESFETSRLRLAPAARARVSAAYRELAARTGVDEPRVAVRSSAVDEDGSAASFAGQHETFLNLTGVDAVVDAVERCWASAFAPRALAYRRERGLDLGRIRLAVLVQVLVPADVSAVLFSANPVSGDRDELVINGAWGLGESLVGGTVTPDTYRVCKRDAALVETRVGDKRRMTVAAPGGSREVEVPRMLRLAPSLDDEQVRELAQLGLSLEASMGWPVDVECAFGAGVLYLLQCRPITTLHAG